MAGSYCYYPVAGTAGFGVVAETIGVLAQVSVTAYQLYLQNLMAKRAEHDAQRAQALAQQQAQAQAAAQAKAAQVVGQQANLMATGSTGGIGAVPVWVWVAGAGGLGAMFFLGRRRKAA